MCRAVRRWALAHPHEFALVYGSPVPGYAAPEATVEPASRVGRVLLGVLMDSASSGGLRPPARPLPEPRLISPDVVAVAGGAPGPPYEDLLERAVVLWIALVGTLTFELFGHLHNVVTDYSAYFDRAMALAADSAGLELPVN